MSIIAKVKSKSIIGKFEKKLKLDNYKNTYIYRIRNDLLQFYEWLEQENIKNYREITNIIVMDYSLYFRERISEKTGKKVKIDSVNVAINSINQFSDWLVETKRIKTGFRVKSLRGGTSWDIEPIKYLTQEELQIVYDELGKTKNPYRDRLIFLLGCQRGMRIGEICALDLDSIDRHPKPNAPMGVIKIERTQAHRTHIIESTPKTPKGKRQVPLNKSILYELDGYLKRERGIRLKPKSKIDSNALFISQKGVRLCKIAVNQLYTRINSRHDFTYKLTPHVLRHTYITLSSVAGASDFLLMDIVGQKDVKAFQRYRHTTKKEMLRIGEYEPKLKNGNGD